MFYEISSIKYIFQLFQIFKKWRFLKTKKFKSDIESLAKINGVSACDVPYLFQRLSLQCASSHR